MIKVNHLRAFGSRLWPGRVILFDSQGQEQYIFKSYGGVAQSVRACGSYPQCPGFESLHRHHNLPNSS